MLPTAIMLWFYPEELRAAHYLAVVPALVSTWFVFPLLARGWSPAIFRVCMINTFCHLLAVIDALRNQVAAWIPTGAAPRAARKAWARPARSRSIGRGLVRADPAGRSGAASSATPRSGHPLVDICAPDRAVGRCRSASCCRSCVRLKPTPPLLARVRRSGCAERRPRDHAERCVTTLDPATPAAPVAHEPRASTASARASPRRERPPARSAGFRTDIQGLRAVAVAARRALPLRGRPVVGGGYVGRRRLLRDLRLPHHRPPAAARSDRTGRVSAARASTPAGSGGCCRRPCVVIAATVVVARLWGPAAADSSRTARDGLFAAFYAMNYRLAGQGVDYQQANAAPSPLQHFWSLAVEEQFYLVWPLLVLVVALLDPTRRRRRAGRCSRVLVARDRRGQPGRLDRDHRRQRAAAPTTRCTPAPGSSASARCVALAVAAR